MYVHRLPMRGPQGLVSNNKMEQERENTTRAGIDLFYKSRMRGIKSRKVQEMQREIEKERL